MTDKERLPLSRIKDDDLREAARGPAYAKFMRQIIAQSRGAGLMGGDGVEGKGHAGPQGLSRLRCIGLRESPLLNPTRINRLKMPSEWPSLPPVGG